MKKQSFSGPILIILLSLLPVSCKYADEPLACPVTEVSNGNVIKVMYKGEIKRVRLSHISAPVKGEDGYEEATGALREMVGDREVILEFEKRGEEQWSYIGNLIAYVYVDGVNVNVEMVRLGHARHFTNFGTGRLADEFERAESEARTNKRGIWGEK